METTPADEGPVRVLLVDDDREDYLLTREMIADIPGDGYVLDWVSNFDAGLEAVRRGHHHIYLIDYQLGPRTGLELLRQAQGRAAGGPMILFTGQGASRVDEEAMRAGAADYLEKAGLSPTLLERAIRYALRQWKAEAFLEHKVAERTAELEATNRILEAEVAERRRAEEALRAADRRKDEFLATLAHELRNPLAPIRNALEIMRLGSGNTPAAERGQALIERQVAQLVRLIDDLLDVSRLTRDKLSLILETVDLADVVAAAVETSRPLFEKANVVLTVAEPEVPVRVLADRVRLVQVFSNLLNNAAKFTDAGGRATLTAGRTADHAVVSVADTGVGIAPELLPRIFDLFTQADRLPNRAQGGLGIGLAIVRRLVDMHGGTVEARSAGTGRGSEFVVRLPQRPAEVQKRRGVSS